MLNDGYKSFFQYQISNRATLIANLFLMPIINWELAINIRLVLIILTNQSLGV